MIKKFDEEYKDLLVEGSEQNRVLKSIEPEYTPFPKLKYNNITFFLLSQRNAGFLEQYCLSQEHKEKLDSIRENMNKNPDLLMNIVLVLDKCLPISYEEFSNIKFSEQSKLLEKIRYSLNEENRELFERVFSDLDCKGNVRHLKTHI